MGERRRSSDKEIGLVMGAVVVIATNETTRADGIAGFTGVLLGDPDPQAGDLTVAINEDDQKVWLLPKSDVQPTGAIVAVEPGEDPEIIRVDNRGNIIG